MILTIEDYDNYDKYRNLLFDRFKLELSGNTACIVGHSHRDPNIVQLVHHAIRLQREAAAPGRIYLLVYELDAERATIWRSRGIYSVIQADINTFVHKLATLKQAAEVRPTADDGGIALPHRLRACTIDIRQPQGDGNARLLFFGAAATYADIHHGFTFERDKEREVPTPDTLVTTILGVAGSGKTTLARRLAARYVYTGQWLGYEHRTTLPREPDLWIEYERRLRHAEGRAILLIDNCPQLQRAVNHLVGSLPEESALRFIVTAETSVWRIRQKSPRFFSAGKEIGLSTLSWNEIHELIALIHRQTNLRILVDEHFLRLSSEEQRRTLSVKCSADMFVCLKTLFSSDSLDEIILREFAEISEPFQDIYRIVAGLEAAGATPHRQMVLRVSGLTPGLVYNALDVLEGLVQEEERQSSLGIYVWRTRHEVIARIISEYKYSDPEDHKALLEQVIASAIPSYYEEARMLREMCNAPRGINAVPSREDRIGLYRRILEINPQERVARHRLIAELLRSERVGDAEAEMRRAESDVGLDPPLKRYRVRIHIARSRAAGLLTDDRRAILRRAYSEAEEGIDRYPDSKYMYFAAADVAEEWFHVTGERGLLESAKVLLERGERKLLDPHVRERLGELWRL